MSDPVLNAFFVARNALLAERAEHLARIKAIDAALAVAAPFPKPPPLRKRLPHGTLRQAAVAWLNEHSGWHSAHAVTAGAKAQLGLVGNHSIIALAVAARQGRIVRRFRNAQYEYAKRGTDTEDPR